MNDRPSKRGIGPEGMAALIVIAVIGVVAVVLGLGLAWLVGWVLDQFGSLGR